MHYLMKITSFAMKKKISGIIFFAKFFALAPSPFQCRVLQFLMRIFFSRQMTAAQVFVLSDLWRHHFIDVRTVSIANCVENMTSKSVNEWVNHQANYKVALYILHCSSDCSTAGIGFGMCVEIHRRRI